MLKIAFQSLPIWKISGGGYPQTPPYKAPKAPAFGTRNNAPPPPLVTKDLATALPVREKLGVDCVF